MLSPAPAFSGREDQTYAVAFDADVIQLLRALSEMCPLSRVAVLTGAQK